MSQLTIYENLLAQLDRLFQHNRQGSIKTRERYYEAMKRFCRYLAEVYHVERLANLAPKHMHSYAAFLKETGRAPSTIKTDFSAIRFFHDQIPNARYRDLPDNTALQLARRQFGGLDRTWSSSEFNKMIACAWREKREDYVAVLCLAYYAGLRLHECYRIDTLTARRALDTGSITVKGKGGKMRTVPVNASIQIALRNQLAATQPGRKLFVPDDEPTDRAMQRLQLFLLRHRSEVQAPDAARALTCHGLRHSYAVRTYLELKNQYDEQTARRKVSKLLGHEREDVTRIYLASLLKGDNTRDQSLVANCPLA